MFSQLNLYPSFSTQLQEIGNHFNYKLRTPSFTAGQILSLIC